MQQGFVAVMVDARGPPTSRIGRDALVGVAEVSGELVTNQFGEQVMLVAATPDRTSLGHAGDPSDVLDAGLA